MKCSLKLLKRSWDRYSKKAWYQTVTEMKKHYRSIGVERLCRLFGKTRQAYYKLGSDRVYRSLAQTMILKLVGEIRKDQPRIGTRKLHYMLEGTLRQHGIEIGRDKFFDLLGQHGLLVRRRKRRKLYTTNSNHPFYKYPNLIKGLQPVCAGALWVSDITYIRMINNFCYLSLVTDAYSRKIVGYCLYPTLGKEGPLGALNMALRQRKDKQLLIHHSDRGIQYCCKEYIGIQDVHKISISMTENGDPYENAMAERVNGILKDEFGLGKTFNNFEQAQAAVTSAIAIYNKQRPHASCGYLTPEQAHKLHGILPSKWRKTPVNQKQDYLTKV